jgi:hypothetical protein
MKKLPAHLRPSRKTSQLASGLLGASLVAYYLRKDRKKKSERRVYYESIHSGLVEFSSGVNYPHDPGKPPERREVDDLYPSSGPQANADTRDRRKYHENGLSDIDDLERDRQLHRRNMPTRYIVKNGKKVESEKYKRWDKKALKFFKDMTAIQKDLDEKYRAWVEKWDVADIGYGDDPDSPGGILCRTDTLSTVNGTTHVSTGIYDNRCA